MKLRVLLPGEVLLFQEVAKVTAEAVDGSFCLLPRHVDCVAVLAPGLLGFDDEAGQETFVAVDEGILVKCGQEVLVSTRNAVRGGDLGTLRRTIEEYFHTRDDRERQARAAVVKLEVGLVRRFLELEHHAG